MSGGIIGWLVGDGAVNNHDAGSLVVGGLGEWYGSEFVVLDGFHRGRGEATGVLHYTVADGRLHYRVADTRPHYTLADRRLHYRVRSD